MDLKKRKETRKISKEMEAPLFNINGKECYSVFDLKNK